MQCQYCNQYNKLRSKILKTEDNSPGQTVRPCELDTKGRENILPNTEACEKFSPAVRFYCDINNCRITYNECFNRFYKDSFCKKCRQYTHVRAVLENYQMIRQKRGGNEVLLNKEMGKDTK